MSERGITYRYRTAFKQKVISEIESGKLTIAEARKIYDIRSQPTIYEWLGKYGKNHLIKKVVRVERKNEKDKLKELERQKRELGPALAQSHLKNLCLEALIEGVEEHYTVDGKKGPEGGEKNHHQSSRKEVDEKFHFFSQRHLP